MHTATPVQSGAASLETATTSTAQASTFPKGTMTSGNETQCKLAPHGVSLLAPDFATHSVSRAHPVPEIGYTWALSGLMTSTPSGNSAYISWKKYFVKIRTIPVLSLMDAQLHCWQEGHRVLGRLGGSGCCANSLPKNLFCVRKRQLRNRSSCAIPYNAVWGGGDYFVETQNVMWGSRFPRCTRCRPGRLHPTGWQCECRSCRARSPPGKTPTLIALPLGNSHGDVKRIEPALFPSSWGN